MKRKSIILLSLLFCFYGVLSAQVHPKFTITKSVKTTPVKNQAKTGTCWSFASMSFFETEAIRMNKPVLDLSEMFIVKHAYPAKAQKYVRLHGMGNFSQGGQAHDALNVIKDYGLVTEETYNGIEYDSKIHNHNEMVTMLTGMLDGMLNSKKRFKPSKNWMKAFTAVIESYLGAEPKEVKYNGKKYNPKEFAKTVVGINTNDYVEFTSYKCYPFYTKVDLEIPDNWSHDLYYNIPANDLIRIMDNAIAKGYSICWDGDVSEDDFNHKTGTAVLSLYESDGIISDGIENMRQSTFDNFSTTDDHLMHIVGKARDENNTIFYLTKNSWGTNSNEYGGYLYMSKWYVQLKTVAIMVHKNAVPKDIRKKFKF